MKLGALVLILLGSLLGASADLRLVIVLLHEERLPSDDWGQVPHQVGWMLWSAPDPVRAFATGERLLTEPALLELMTAEAPVEGSTAQRVFQRRNGKRPPASSLLALSAGRLAENGALSKTLASRLGGSRLRGVYVRVPQSPPPSQYALLVINRQGYGPFRTYEDLELMRVGLFQSDYDWALLELERWDYLGLELLVAEGVETWVICLPRNWETGKSDLTAVVRYSARESYGLLTSPSTRWTGLVREVDLVPTLTRHLTGTWDMQAEGAPIVEARQFDWHRFWNGLLPRTVLRGATTTVGIDLPRSALDRVATHWQVQREFAPLVLSAVVAGVGVWTIAGLVLYRLRWFPRRLRRLFVGGLAVFGLFPAVAIWYAYCPYELWTGNRQTDLSALTGWLVMGWLLLALAMAGLSRLFDTPPLWSAAVLVLGVYLGELFVAGGYGLNRSLTHFALQPNGRLFGMDYPDLGFVMASALLVPTLWMEHKGRTRLGGRGQTGLGLLYGLVLAGVGVSLFGAFVQAIFPLTLALGLMALHAIGMQTETPIRRQFLLQSLSLIALGAGLTAGAVALDQTQPWQRQAYPLQHWISEGWHLERLILPEPMVVLLGWVGVWLGFRAIKWLILPVWVHSPPLRGAILAGTLGGLMSVLISPQGWLTLGVVAFYLLAMVIEYQVGAHEWGYRPKSNGAVKARPPTH